MSFSALIPTELFQGPSGMTHSKTRMLPIAREKKKICRRAVHCPGTYCLNTRVWVCVCASVADKAQSRPPCQKFLICRRDPLSPGRPIISMRLRAWAGACCLLPVLVLLSVHHAKANPRQPKERHYFIAAVEIDWNYSGNDTNG